jgi:ribosome recycling factor
MMLTRILPHARSCASFTLTRSIIARAAPALLQSGTTTHCQSSVRLSLSSQSQTITRPVSVNFSTDCKPSLPILSSRRSSSLISRCNNVVYPSWRFMSKKKKKGKTKTVAADDDELLEWELEVDLELLQEQFDKATDFFKTDLSTLFVGRASPTQLEHIPVEAYGSQTSLMTIAQVTAKGPQLLIVTMHDPSVQKAAITGILESGLGLNPQVEDNRTLKVPFPKPTKESRDQTIKLVKQKADHSRGVVRHHRHDIMETLKKHKKEMSEDDFFRVRENIQTMTDAAIKDIDQAAAEKEKEIEST